MPKFEAKFDHGQRVFDTRFPGVELFVTDILFIDGAEAPFYSFIWADPQSKGAIKDVPERRLVAAATGQSEN